jgi:hypothetical protein
MTKNLFYRPRWARRREAHHSQSSHVQLVKVQNVGCESSLRDCIELFEYSTTRMVLWTRTSMSTSIQKSVLEYYSSTDFCRCIRIPYIALKETAYQPISPANHLFTFIGLYASQIMMLYVYARQFKSIVCCGTMFTWSNTSHVGCKTNAFLSCVGNNNKKPIFQNVNSIHQARIILELTSAFIVPTIAGFSNVGSINVVSNWISDKPTWIRMPVRASCVNKTSWWTTQSCL